MRETVTTTGRVERGQLRLENGRAFREAIARFGDGTALVVTVKREEQTRSAQANRYLWGVVYALMAEDTGHEPEDLHEDMKARFLLRTLTYTDKTTGEVVERQVPRSSARLTVHEFFHFVEQVRLFAAEFLGLTIPDPDPDWWLEPTP